MWQVVLIVINVLKAGQAALTSERQMQNVVCGSSGGFPNFNAPCNVFLIFFGLWAESCRSQCCTTRGNSRFFPKNLFLKPNLQDRLFSCCFCNRSDQICVSRHHQPPFLLGVLLWQQSPLTTNSGDAASPTWRHETSHSPNNHFCQLSVQKRRVCVPETVHEQRGPDRGWWKTLAGLHHGKCKILRARRLVCNPNFEVFHPLMHPALTWS